MHLALAGNIGAGKTTLTRLLANHYGWEAHYESVDENPYLNDFYNDMMRWSFNLQVYFLHSRLFQMMNIRENNLKVIQDRTVYEDAYIFAPNLHEMGLMSSRDFETYKGLFDSLIKAAQAPDLLIYLKASVATLVEQISKRGRKYEEGINLNYLYSLNNRYEEWIVNYEGKKLIVDVNELDFANDQEDLGKIIELIDAEIHGLF